MQKGYKRTGKAIAVLHFFIGLIVVAIFLIAAYFCLEKMDYSHRLNPDTTVRPYVEMTATPDSFGSNDGFMGEPDGDETGVVDLLPTEAPTEEPTLEPTQTPEPTPIATPTPIPTPSPTPSPEPTKIPSKKLSKSRTTGFTLPEASKDATAEITKIYVSEPNNNTVVEISGYCYLDKKNFNAKNSQVFLIISQEKSKRVIAYQAKMGVTLENVTHEGANCKNVDKSNFRAIVRVLGFPNGEYELGAALVYQKNGKTAVTYYKFDDTLTVSHEAVVENASAPAAEDGAEVVAGEPIAIQAIDAEGEAPGASSFDSDLDGTTDDSDADDVDFADAGEEGEAAVLDTSGASVSVG